MNLVHQNSRSSFGAVRNDLLKQKVVIPSRDSSPGLLLLEELLHHGRACWMGLSYPWPTHHGADRSVPSTPQWRPPSWRSPSDTDCTRQGKCQEEHQSVGRSSQEFQGSSLQRPPTVIR